MDCVNFGQTGLHVAWIEPGNAFCGNPAADALLPGFEAGAFSVLEGFPFPGRALERSMNFFPTARGLSITLLLARLSRAQRRSSSIFFWDSGNRRRMEEQSKTEKLMKGGALFPLRCDLAIC